MKTEPSSAEQNWSENDSQTLENFEKYFIPEHEAQIDIICDLVPPLSTNFTIMELGCGEGTLSRALLKRFPDCSVIGFDDTETNLLKASLGLKEFKERFIAKEFDLKSQDWRKPGVRMHAVVSSLTIHHLDDSQKQELFNDVYRIISPGGVFIIADVIRPAGTTSRRLAAKSWDAVVKQRAIELDGNEEAFLRFSSDEWNFFRSPNEEDHLSTLLEQLVWLIKAGFKQVDAYWVKAGHAILGGVKA